MVIISVNKNLKKDWNIFTKALLNQQKNVFLVDKKMTNVFKKPIKYWRKI